MPASILITGSTGYVGGRLRRRLEQRGESVRCMARNPKALESRVGPRTEVIAGDALDPESLGPALEGIQTAYYLIHSIGVGAQFEGVDRTAAQNFARAARRAGVQKIIYLGGLAHGEDLSPHMRSRQEVGDLLAESGVPLLEFRASIVIGSGSLSFELIRSLVRRLPIMITPRWVEVEAQPIAIADVLDYLVEALDMPLSESRVFEIGGADRVSYGEMMKEYARQRGLRRYMLRVPLLTPRLSSLWLGLVTPLYARVGRKLIESIRQPSVIQDRSALECFSIRPLAMKAAIKAAILDEDRTFSETNWFDALAAGGAPRTWAGVRFHNRLIDSRQVHVRVDPHRAFAPIDAIGGSTGWYAYNFLWKLRGFLDLLVGGVGVRRGRPPVDHLHVGSALDFWRVEGYEPNRLLRLSAEMKVPGRAWLEFEVTPAENGASIRQTALFDPVGLTGLAYWYLVYPLHCAVFAAMLAQIALEAEKPKT